jgi:hypothetical protein
VTSVRRIEAKPVSGASRKPAESRGMVGGALEVERRARGPQAGEGSPDHEVLHLFAVTSAQGAPGEACTPRFRFDSLFGNLEWFSSIILWKY